MFLVSAIKRHPDVVSYYGHCVDTSENAMLIVTEYMKGVSSFPCGVAVIHEIALTGKLLPNITREMSTN